MAKAAFFDNPRGTIEDALQSAAADLPGFLQKALSDALAGDSPVPTTISRTSHAFTLHAILGGRASIVGAVYQFGTEETRTVEDEFEVNANATGLPVDMVPQNLTGRSITISRYDLYSKLIEEVFQRSPDELITLASQIRGFSLREMWRDPSSFIGLTPTARAYEYGRCWFTRKGRRMSANDNRLVFADANLSWGSRRRVI